MAQAVRLHIGPIVINMILDVDAACLERASPFEPETAYALFRILRQGDTVVDGGANFGYVSLVMAALIGERGHVLAFEPAPYNIAQLKRNLALNKVLHVVEIIDKPLWSRDEGQTLYLFNEPGLAGLSAINNASMDGKPIKTIATTKVMTTRIDALGINPRLIKLDVEGSEVQALQGAARTIKHSGCYVICEANVDSLPRFGESPESLRAFAKEQFGYDSYFLTQSFPFPVFVPPGVTMTKNRQDVNLLLATQDMVAAAFPVMPVSESLVYGLSILGAA